MRVYDTTDVEVALDACIDRIVDGEPWTEVLPAGDAERREVTSLVAVACRLLEASEKLPRLQDRRKHRVWSRVFRALGIERLEQSIRALPPVAASPP